MQNAGLDESQAGIKMSKRNINNLRCADDTILMAESEEELKSLWMMMKEECDKAGLKLSIKKTKIMASSPITSWQIERGKVEAVTDFLFLGFKITADRDCSHKTKRHMLLGRKAITNLDSILKFRDITLSTKVRISSVQFSSVAQSYPTLCNPMDCSTPGLLVHHQLLELTQIHVHRVGDAIQPSHPLSSPSPPAFNLFQNQDLFQ